MWDAIVNLRNPRQSISVSIRPTIISHPLPFRVFSSSVFSAKITDNGFNGSRKVPILLFDIMDTIVPDPFFDAVPPFFRMSFEELTESQHPTAWMEFEKGMIDEGSWLEYSSKMEDLLIWKVSKTV